MFIVVECSNTFQLFTLLLCKTVLVKSITEIRHQIINSYRAPVMVMVISSYRLFIKHKIYHLKMVLEQQN